MTELACQNLAGNVMAENTEGVGYRVNHYHDRVDGSSWRLAALSLFMRRAGGVSERATDQLA